MRKPQLALICTAVALACTTDLLAQASLTPLPTFGTGGWVAPGTTNPYVSTGNTERGLSYNPTTGHVVLVARQNVGGISNNIRILDGTTGADLFGLDNTGISGGTFAVNTVDVAEDGAIYVGNLSTSITSNFKVYKWDSEATGATTPASVAFDSLTNLPRTGDAFAVTGGVATPAQFAAAGSNNVNASNFAAGSLDGSNTFTAYQSIAGTTTTSNDYRLALTWIDQNTLIGNQGATARLTSISGGTATLAASIPLGGAARRAMDYAVIGGRPLLAIIDTNSSQVAVFDITNPTTPVLLVTGNNTTGVLSANANGSGAVTWGTITGNSATLYAMSSNQGIQAFDFALDPASATNYGTGCDGLALAANGLPTIGNLGFELAVSNVPAVSPVAFVAFGSAVVNPGIDLTAIGMPGCFSYTSFDIGLLGTGPVIAGTGIFAFGIPNDASLAGALVAAQGVSLTLATPLQLASSNGTEVVLGF